MSRENLGMCGCCGSAESTGKLGTAFYSALAESQRAKPFCSLYVRGLCLYQDPGGGGEFWN